MLGWVITCHDDTAQDMLHRLEKVRPAGAMPGGRVLAWTEFKYVKSDDVRCPA